MPRAPTIENLSDRIPHDQSPTTEDTDTGLVLSQTRDYGFIIVKYTYTRDANDLLTNISAEVIG